LQRQKSSAVRQKENNFMRTKRYAYIAAAVLFFANLGLAHAETPVKASIPFDFVAGGKAMPAGTYTFRDALPSSNTQLALSDGRGHGVLAAATMLDTHEPGSKLVFRKHGDSYFLSDVFSPTGRLHFNSDRSESKLAKSASNETVSIPVGD
jgi:hypothetical protein